jgi:hypothetical protein
MVLVAPNENHDEDVGPMRTDARPLAKQEEICQRRNCR